MRNRRRSPDSSGERGKAYIHRFEAEGGAESFFTRIEARGVRYGMGLFDGLAGEWDAGTVTVTAAGIAIKAGAEDEEEAGGDFRGAVRRA